MKQNTKLAIGAGVGLLALGGLAYAMSGKSAAASTTPGGGGGGGGGGGSGGGGGGGPGTGGIGSVKVNTSTLLQSGPSTQATPVATETAGTVLVITGTLQDGNGALMGAPGAGGGSLNPLDPGVWWYPAIDPNSKSGFISAQFVDLQ